MLKVHAWSLHHTQYLVTTECFAIKQCGLLDCRIDSSLKLANINLPDGIVPVILVVMMISQPDKFAMQTLAVEAHANHM